MVSLCPEGKQTKPMGDNNVTVVGATFMNTLLNRFVKNESGATAVEYGLIAALIATGLITAMGYLTTGLSTAFTTIKTKLNVTG